ncbi:MAG: hypothetical protein COA79_14300 [Planctomycetota bacterium]|nr:MAG: hypothetical protein COA79_14300 [Planctomycetota bacterium]
MHSHKYFQKIITYLIISALIYTNTSCTTIAYRPRHLFRTVFNISPKSTPPGTIQFEKDMSRLTDTILTKGNHAEPLFNGEEVFPKMTELIRNAKEDINFEVYILKEDQTGRFFMNELVKAKQKNNPNIKFMTDELGNDLHAFRRTKILKKSGIKRRIFNPLFNWTIFRYNNRNHRKTLSVDGKYALISGLNLGNEYRGHGFNRFRDNGVYLEGPIVFEIEKSFKRTWKQAGYGWIEKDLPIIGINSVKRGLEKGLLSLVGLYRPNKLKKRFQENAGDMDIRLVTNSPDWLSSRLLDMYLLSINSAEKKVYITSSYFVPPILIQRALKKAAKRGVDVRLLLQGKTDQNFVRQLAINKYGRLLDAGVKIYEWPNSILHVKTIVVDGIWSSLGSCNIDGRSFFLNYEANVAITNKSFSKTLENKFLEDIQLSETISKKEWKKRKWYKKLIGLLITPFKGQF